MYNFAEAIEIESRDVVIALPSQVDVQSALGVFIVHAYDECCIPDTFHTSRSLRLFPVEFLYFYRRRHWDELFRQFHPAQPRPRAESELSFLVEIKSASDASHG